MDKYEKFLLEAKGKTKRSIKTKSNTSAPGFGAPVVSNKSKQEVTKDQKIRWQSRSEKYRKSYLSKYPNSKYKDISNKGSILTRSKKISNKPWAKAVTESATQVLLGFGVKNNGNNKEHAKTALRSLRRFLKTPDRSEFTTKAKDAFSRFRSKLNNKDRDALDNEADVLNNRNGTGAWASQMLDKKGMKGVLPGLIGLAAGAALFGGIATGFVPADVLAFIGVKILDAGFESIRHAGREPLSALLAGHAIGNFFKSKDSDDYLEEVERKMSKKVGDVSDDEETENQPEETEEDKLKRLVKEKFGESFDFNKYTLDENGNLKRKKADAPTT